MLRSPARLFLWISVLFAWAILAYVTYVTLDSAAVKPTLAASASMTTYRFAPETVAGGGWSTAAAGAVSP
jgi:hypothetical protein